MKTLIFIIQNSWSMWFFFNKMCLWNTIAPDNGQFQRWTQGHSNILIPVGKSHHKKCSCAIWNSNTYYLEERTNVNFFFLKVELQGQGHRVKNNDTYGKVLSPGILMWNIKALALTVQKLLAKLKFSKIGLTPKPRSQGQKSWYRRKGLVNSITHVKYQSSSTHCSKVISMVKVFKKWVQGQGHRVKNNDTHGKVLSQKIFIWNIKALTLTVQKVLSRLKFQRGGLNDRMTDGTRTICSPILDLGGKKWV